MREIVLQTRDLGIAWLEQFEIVLKLDMHRNRDILLHGGAEPHLRAALIVCAREDATLDKKEGERDNGTTATTPT